MPAATEGRPPRRVRRALSVLMLVVAIGLGAVGVWLIVSGDTKGERIGVLLGLWGLLLGAYQFVGHRHALEEAAPAPAAEPGTALETRADAEAMREYQQRLEVMLRHQIELMGAEMASMRAELATLRSELVEKVGGQLRLERTETTRLIGSDIGALQNEVRQLAMRSALLVGEPVHDAPTVTMAPLPATPAVTVHPEPGVAAPADAMASAESVVAQPEPVVAAAPAPADGAPAVPDPYQPVPPPEQGAPERIEQAPPQPGAVSEVAPEPAAPEPAAPAAEGAPADPFADLPRLTPFRDDEPAGATAGGTSRRPAHGSFDAALGLTDASPAAAPSGRHAQPVTSGAGGGGRRRRSEDGGGTNILAQILNRERSDRG